ncbi:phospholipase effector Tle1 domain-containing protein [Chryseobacterium tructae]|uniref:Phospholipase effector Tle1 domain-containing protein n=2 Tax=Chryseobacterium tructae TaxID=1037380 RepID=A0ABV7XWA9_9FLAO
MKIIGETRPLTYKLYNYSLLAITGNPKVKEWKIEYNGKILSTNAAGIFKFHPNLAGKKVRLIAVVTQNSKNTEYSIDLYVLLGNPKILSIEWQDFRGKPIGKRKVGYLDKIRLAIKTINIPKGDSLKISVYEDDTTGDRTMGVYTTSGVDDKGFAYLYFNQLSLYQDALNKKDWIDESEHEYYIKVKYENYINRTEEKIQLVVQNELVQHVDKPQPTNKPVVVAAPDKKPKQNDKVKKNVVFNMFFDGTMNNMTNTTERIGKTDVYNRKSNKKDDSYTNFYSNVALLYMNNDVKENEDIIKIYTEGIGTEDKKMDQTFPGGALGTGIAIYMRGIKDKVQRGIQQMKDFADKKYFDKGVSIGKVTINVFGFSRGAAAARYFLSQDSLIMIKLNLKSFQDITFNFIGLFDTVASYGILHLNDVIELQLKLKNRAKKIVQLAAADEYRNNFKLTNIDSSVKAGVGYQLTMPGVHSDIGGGYSEVSDEKRYLGEYMVYGDNDITAKKELEKIKKRYIEEGWYQPEQFMITKELKTNFSKLYNLSYSHLYTLYGVRKGLSNSYQYIPFAIMKTFCEKHGKMVFKKTTDNIYTVSKELQTVKGELYDYAIKNDGINSLAVTLPKEQLMWVRNKYLHRSNKDDETFKMDGRYVNGKPERDILKG